MSTRTFFPVALIAASCSAAPVWGMGLVGEERTVITHASAGLLTQDDSDTAPDLNPWNGQSVVNLVDGQTGEFGNASAIQNSSLDQGSLQTVQFDGFLTATGSTDGFGSARSRLVTQIEVLNVTRFAIWGEVTSLLGANGSSATARLINANNIMRYEYNSAFFGLDTDGTNSFRSTGVLPAGTWTLEIDFRVTGFEGATDTLNHDVTFFLPSPGSACLVCLGMLGSTRRRR